MFHGLGIHSIVQVVYSRTTTVHLDTRHAINAAPASSFVCFDFGWHRDPRRMDISWHGKGVFGSLKFGLQVEVDDQSRLFGAADK